ncbi:hypothetical protein Peur_044578 [Populus x canadensis]
METGQYRRSMLTFRHGNFWGSWPATTCLPLIAERDRPTYHMSIRVPERLNGFFLDVLYSLLRSSLGCCKSKVKNSLLLILPGCAIPPIFCPAFPEHLHRFVGNLNCQIPSCFDK